MVVFATAAILLLRAGVAELFGPFRYLLWLTPLVGLVCFVVAPQRSAVHGLAGDAGYDELNDAERKEGHGS